MTSKELFERFGGGHVKIKRPNEVRVGERLRFCGYECGVGRIIMEFPKGHGVLKKGFEDDVLLPGLPDDCELLYDGPEFYDWDNVVFLDKGGNICCRCGNRYQNKKEHRKVCK